MAASDALPVPLKNAAFRLYFDVRTASNSLVESWTGADTEVSLDGDLFGDATNEAVEIGTSGIGYIDLTASEMNADCVLVKTTVANSGATPIVTPLYPQEGSDIRVRVDGVLSGAIDAGALAADAANEIADAVLTRSASNVEGSAGEYTICTLILAALESSRSSTTWTIKRTDGTTTHVVKTLTLDANANPVTGVS